MKKVVVTGPESTGKSVLSEFLARHYHTVWIPEYAREYMKQIKRDYTYEDLVLIARKQVDEHTDAFESKKELVIFDTGLIVTKIWFLEVYDKYPIWLDEQIMLQKPDLYLLCYHDLPWEYDLLRENGSEERRAYLFDQYLKEIKKTGSDYQIIKGFNQERFKLAIQTIEKYFYSDVEN